MAKKFFDARGLDCYGVRTVGLLEEPQANHGVDPRGFTAVENHGEGFGLLSLTMACPIPSLYTIAL